MNATTSITALATTTDSVAITSPWSSHKALDVKQTPASVGRKAHSYDPDAA